MLRHVPLSCLALSSAGLAVLAAVPGVAHGQGRSPDIASVFFVAKSENRNQVHYGVRLDETCAPTGRSPVFAYWRMLERGPLATEPLLSLEQPAYGVAGQRVLARGASGGQVEVQLNALRARTILVASSPRGQSEQAGQPGERCAAAATTTIGGAPAALTSVYAKLGWPFGVAYLTLSGRTLADGRAIRERIVP